MNNIYRNLIFLYLIVYATLIVLNHLEIVSWLFLISSVYAGILNLINTYLAVVFFNKSYKKGNTNFLIYNLGGMGIRLFGLLLVFVLIIKFLNIDEYGFILVFFLFYFISLVFEVLFYLKKTKKLT